MNCHGFAVTWELGAIHRETGLETGLKIETRTRLQLRAMLPVLPQSPSALAPEAALLV
jgi:hypothetical protein